MNATTSAAVYGPLSGADLETELAHARIAGVAVRDARMRKLGFEIGAGKRPVDGRRSRRIHAFAPG